MRRRTVLLACATIGLGLSEHASAQELTIPVPTPESDVAAIVAAVESAVDVELPTLDGPETATATTVDPPPVEPVVATETTETPVETAPSEQYQPPVPQYQPPEDGAANTPDTSSNATTPTSPAEAEEEPTGAPATATSVEEAALPETWTWNWNWNCVDPPSATAQPEGASTWSWNWNWNCDPDANPSVDLDQYQPPTTQYQDGNTTIFQGGNINVGIRVASPGDDGPVTQTTSTLTAVTTTIVTEVTQTIQEVTASPVAAIALPALPAMPSLPPEVIELSPEVIELSTPFDELLDVVLPPIDVPPLPPLVVPPLAGIAQAVAVGLGLTSPSATRRAPGKPRREAPRSRVVLHSVGSAATPATPTLVAPARAASDRPVGSSYPSRKGRLPLLPPLPGGPGAGAGQSASAPGLVLAAFGAALAAYLLIPPLGARPLRRARDRRRLGLVAAPLDPPG